MAAFTWGEAGAQLTPDQIAAQRRVAEAMMERGGDTSPILSPWQGVARVADGLLGGYKAYKTNEAEKANRSADQEMITKLLTGQQSVGSPLSLAPPEPTATPEQRPAVQSASLPAAAPTGNFMPNVGGLASSAPSPMDANAKAISGIESGGRYDLLGPMTKGDRAYGKYQVMGANVGPWTKAHVGQEMTPDQFLANPAAQDAVFKGEFGRLAAKHGPEGAARAWFAGEGGMNDPNRKDVLGTTVAGYADKFNRGLSPADSVFRPAAAPVAQTQPAAASGLPGVNPALIQALTSPYSGEGVKKVAQLLLQQQMGDKVTYQTTPDGDILAMDPHGRTAPKVVYRSAAKPITVKEDDRLWDPATRSFIGGAAAAPTSVPGPDGKPIAIPPGLSSKDAKEFTKRVTESTADASTGKKTEVQAKDEKFANKMELAEKHITGLEGEGTSRISRGLDAKVPFTNTGVIPFSNSFQSDNYQKYRQGRDNFITALLRDESGAAIGTEEFNRYERELFPQPGDGKPVIEQKREARRIAIEAMKKGAGPGYKSPTANPSAVAPAGVDAKVWGAMTPEERALWK